MLNGVNPKDGLGILRRLQEIYAPASMKDRNQALAYLNEITNASKGHYYKFHSEVSTSIENPC